MESRIERLCIRRGLKMTGQRRVVAKVLSEAGDHPDVEELYRRASALDQHISIATVYRTVRLFEEQGILERRDFGGGRARYEPSEDGPHYHLIDVDTGKVIEFQDPEHEQLMQAIAARLGFDVVSLRLELFGRRRGSPEPLRADERRPEDGRSEVGVFTDRDPEPGHSDNDNLGAGASAAGGSKPGGSNDGGVEPTGSELVPGRDSADGGSDSRLRGATKGASR
jgi:Fur family ferric uptake transcriptional regulator